jgi:hypothetical protein
LEQAITLYLELKPGEKADFQVVGLATAAFAEMVKEIAFIVDPTLDIRIKFESGTEGSLGLNGIIETLKTPEGRRGAIMGIVAGTAISFVQDVRNWGVSRLLDHYFPSAERSVLTPEDIERIERAVNGVKEGKIAKDQARKVYREIERDDAIQSVGTITTPNSKPPDPVPRSEFTYRAGVALPSDTTQRSRTMKSTERLTLISPVLLLVENRVWRFRSAGIEHSYYIKDEKFLGDLLAGRRRMPMKEGIQITAEIEVHEIFEGQVWVPKQRFITRVVRVHAKSKEPDLFSQPKKRKASKRKKRKT